MGYMRGGERSGCYYEAYLVEISNMRTSETNSDHHLKQSQGSIYGGGMSWSRGGGMSRAVRRLRGVWTVLGCRCHLRSPRSIDVEK
jgi:hypothetical protein